jgi:hypothetical protein
MIFIVSSRVKNGVPQGQIFLKELYRVVPQMKGLDEHFPDQLKFWRYDVIWWRNDVNHFLLEAKRICLPLETMYARMQGCE